MALSLTPKAPPRLRLCPMRRLAQGCPRCRLPSSKTAAMVLYFRGHMLRASASHTCSELYHIAEKSQGMSGMILLLTPSAGLVSLPRLTSARAGCRIGTLKHIKPTSDNFCVILVFYHVSMLSLNVTANPRPSSTAGLRRNGHRGGRGAAGLGHPNALVLFWHQVLLRGYNCRNERRVHRVVSCHRITLQDHTQLRG